MHRLFILGLQLFLISSKRQFDPNDGNKTQNIKRRFQNNEDPRTHLPQSPKTAIDHYLLRYSRDANSSGDGNSNESKCREACTGDSEVNLCPTEEDNWLVWSKPEWARGVGYRVLFAGFYLVILLYLFVGVSIVSDKFMAAIEVITAKEKTVVVQTENGDVITMHVTVWNDTVANLTLMALGSSAPEIMLAIVEVCVDDFNAGLLGPGTVIGSAAFNFFVIIAICILSVPKGQTKKVEKFGVFVFTCVFSIWAYLWLFIILKGISPCVIDIWEAFVTLLFFPLFVLIAWRIDKRESRMSEKARKVMIETESRFYGPEGGVETAANDGDDDDSGEGFEDKSISMLRSEGQSRINKRRRGRPLRTRGGGGEDDDDDDIDDSAVVAPSQLSVNTRNTTDVMVSQCQRFKLTNTRKQEFLMRFQIAKRENPDVADDDLLDIVAKSMLESSRKSKAYYRLIALGQNKELNSLQSQRYKQRRTWNFSRTRPRTTPRSHTQRNEIEDGFTSRRRQQMANDPYPDHFKLRFDPVEYVVAEDMGSVKLYVVRLLNKGNRLADFYTRVDYRTVEGTAKAGTDFVASRGTLYFEPGDFIKTIEIQIINDDIYEEDEFFTVVLENVINQTDTPTSALSSHRRSDRSGSKRESNTISTSNGRHRVKRPTNKRVRIQSEASEMLPCMLTEDEARVVVLDEDHRGIFAFQYEQVEVEEAQQEVTLVVKRWKGARGVVEVPYTTDEFTATPGTDYIHTEGVLRFENGDTSCSLTVSIIDTSQYEKDKIFHVRLSEPRMITTQEERLRGRVLTKQERFIDLKGEARLGNKVSCLVTIVENKKLRTQIDNMSDKLTVADIIKDTTYSDQFREAVVVHGEEDEETGETKKPTKCNWFCHILTVFWKILFAIIPPPGCCGGWPCFIGSLVGIGLLTYLIEMVATNVGCAAGLKDIVTAISIVALGTSLPDTFASRAAAIADDTADAAIGNVTGSNAVNVFLGIGLAWLLGAIVQKCRGCEFSVEPGDLGFNVVVFTGLVVLGVCVLMYRRFSKSIGAELGGPMASKVLTSIIMIMFWLIYLTLATLAAYKVFSPGF